MDLTAEQKRTLIVVALVLGSVGAGALVVYAAHLSNTVPVGAPVTLHAPSGPAVTINQDADVNLTDPFPDATTVEIVSSQGNLTATGPDFANVTVDNINGTWTNTSSLEVSGQDLQIDPGDKSAVNVTGGLDSLAWRQSMAGDDGTVDFVYSASSTGNVTLRGLTGSTTYAAIDADTNTVLATGTTNGAGTATFTSLNTGSHDVLLQTSSGGPSVSNRVPTDGTQLDSTSVTLEAQVNDSDLPADDVTIEWYVDSSLENTETIQSNQTVSHSTTISLGGTHTWHMELEDAFGNTLTTSTFSMETPANLSIRNESAPDTLVTDAEVEITAYFSGEVERRSTTNGNISLTNFPIDEPIIVKANASGYHARTAVIEDVFDQQSMYLLNDSVSTHLIRFDLQDPIGLYPESDTVLFVELDLNRSGTVNWHIIAGDNFGVQGVPVDLKQDERYRIRVKNLETGDVTVIGAYTAIQSETVIVEPGGPIEVANPERDYYWTVEENETAQEILVTYNDTASHTQEIKVTVHERYNESNLLVDNTTFTNTNGLVYQIPMTADQTNKSWMAVLYIDRGDGFKRYVVPASGGPRSLIPGGLDEVWVQAVGVFIMIITAMAFSVLNQGAGAIVTSLVGGVLWWFGVFSGQAVGAVVVLAISISLLYHFREGATPG